LEQPGREDSGMDPQALSATIYLGDRGCKRVEIDGWNSRVLITVDCISRVRSESGSWDFYTQEDIDDGVLVIEGARWITFEPPGYIPNDEIRSFEVEPVTPQVGTEASEYIFTLSVVSNLTLTDGALVCVKIIGTGFFLQDPQCPGLRITE
jgi:hypothetical protein